MTEAINKVIFWDFDGTLAHSPGLWSNAVYSELKETLPDLEVGIERVQELTRSGFPWHDPPETDHRELALPGAWWAYMENLFSRIYAVLGIAEPQSTHMARRLRSRIIDPGNFSLYPDTVQVLEECRKRGYRNWLLSNHFPELEDILSALGIHGLFDGIAISANIGWEKPNPEIFKAALIEAGNPDDCYMVGDNPAADIDGARRMGIPAILIQRKAGKSLSPELLTPDFTCGCLTDVLNFIK